MRRWVAMGVMAGALAVRAQVFPFGVDRTMELALRAGERAEAPAGRFDGRLLDAAGAPVRGVTVHLFSGHTAERQILGPSIASATVDDEGRFSIEPPAVPPADSGYWVVVHGANGEPLQGWSHINQNRNLGDVRLETGAAFSGRLITPEGAPLASTELKIMLVLDHPSCPHAVELRSLLTDAEGAFSAAGLASTRYRLVRVAADYVVREEIAVAGDFNHFEIRAGATSTLEGEVTDADGRPLAGVKVELGEGLKETVTDAAGVYRFTGLEKQVYSVTVHHPRLVSPRGPRMVLSIGEGVVARRNFRLVPPASIRIKAVPVGAEPLPEGKVRLQVRTKCNDGRDYSTDELREVEFRNGVGLIENVIPAVTDLSVPYDQRGDFSRRVNEIRPGQEVPLELPMVRTAPLRVRVVDATGRPLDGVQVTVAIERPPAGALQALTRVVGSLTAASDRGECRFADVPAGTLHLRTRSPDYPPVRLKVAFDARAPREVTLEVADPVPLSGEVVDEDGRPVAGAVVMVSQGNPPGEPADDAGFWAGRDDYHRAVRTDEAGRFTLREVTGRHALVRVNANGYELYRTVLDRIETGTSPFRVRLARGAGVSGTVLAADEKPMAGVQVAVSGPGGGAADTVTRTAVTDAGGRFVIQGLLPGIHTLWLSAGPGRPAFYRMDDVPAGSEEMLIILGEPPAAAEGQ